MSAAVAPSVSTLQTTLSSMDSQKNSQKEGSSLKCWRVRVLYPQIITSYSGAPKKIPLFMRVHYTRALPPLLAW